MRERLLKCLFLAVCVCCDTLAVLGNDTTRWQPEWGVDFTTEHQLAHTGKYNFANLLRLKASLPVGHSLSFDIGSLSTYMTNSEGIVSDLQMFSNIDAENIPFALSLCGFDWKFSDRHSLFLGIRNMNEDYFTSPVTSLFTNSSCGIFPTISGNYDIANYPLASLGAHYMYTAERLGVQASLYNGQGYRRFAGRENVFRFCPQSDGVFALTQIDYHHRGNSYFLGVCGHYGESPYVDSRSFDITPWAYAELRITGKLHLMAAYSHAFASFSACSDFVGIGGKYAWRRHELGVFSDYARFIIGDEYATEITFKTRITPYLYLQPALHFIVGPSIVLGETRMFNAVGMLRLGVSI